MVGASVVTLNQAVWDSLAEEVTFNQRLKGREGSCVDLGGKARRP